MKHITKTTFTVALLTILMAVPAFAANVNKSVDIEPGATVDGASSVNGSVTVGADAVVDGNVKTVNGAVRVNAGATIENASTVNGGLRIDDNVNADNLTTVNGTIRVGESVVIAGKIKAVNGEIIVAKGTEVAGDVGNVNGEIELSGMTVSGDVFTVNGDLDVVDGTIIEGGILVEKPKGWGWNNSKKRKPRIVIGPGSQVKGEIDLEREVELYISDTATVGGVKGVMSIDDAKRFSGSRP